MGHLTGVARYQDPVQAVDYYCSRLLSLEDYSRTMGQGNLFVESNELVNNTADTLSTITNWLNLSQPLDKTYSFFPQTGEPGYGDPSANIKSGVMGQTSANYDVEIPLALLEQGEAAYVQCRDALLSNVSESVCSVAP
jgi:hypothetical protein